MREKEKLLEELHSSMEQLGRIDFFLSIGISNKRRELKAEILKLYDFIFEIQSIEEAKRKLAIMEQYVAEFEDCAGFTDKMYCLNRIVKGKELGGLFG